MAERLNHYFEDNAQWRDWLHGNHEKFTQVVYLILYKLETKIPTMR